MEKKQNRFWNANSPLVALSSSFLSILVGIFLGFIVVLLLDAKNAGPAFGNFLLYGFKSQSTIASFIYLSAPYLMCGLAVAFCFKSGSFNIGGPGQFIMGAMGSYLSAIYLKSPWYVSILAAMLFGAIWGSIPGILKSYFNVNEVLSAIMLNWLALITMTGTLESLNLFQNGQTIKINALNSNPNAILPSWGLDKFDSHFTIAIFIGILFAIAMWIIIKYRVFGFTVRSCGLNKDASRYAGMNTKLTIISTFAISGLLAAVGGAFYMLLPPGSNLGLPDTYTNLNLAGGMGFDGISVALLANNNPLGCIFSALFISYTKYSASGLNPFFNRAVGDVVISIIVFFASFASLVRIFLTTNYYKKLKDNICKKRAQKKDEAVQKEVM